MQLRFWPAHFATLFGDRASRAREVQVKVRLYHCAAQPSAEIVQVLEMRILRGNCSQVEIFREKWSQVEILGEKWSEVEILNEKCSHVDNIPREKCWEVDIWREKLSSKEISEGIFVRKWFCLNLLLSHFDLRF